MNIIWLKIFSLLIIFIVGFFAGIAPLKRSLSVKGEKRLTLGNAFAGGVFLGAGLLHMLPDAIENFNTLAKNIEFPIPALIAGIGFIIIMILENSMSGGSHHQGTEAKKQTLYPIILTLVLSVHSLIAGASLGLEGTLASASAIFFAIIAHKGAAAFSLGVSLKKSAYSKARYIRTIAIFASMTSIGVLLGTAFSTILSGETSMVFEMIFDSLAAGTFLYIAIVEIMAEVFEKPNNIWAKLCLICSGFGLMALIAIWA